jgi:phosphatidylcholine synthase
LRIRQIAAWGVHLLTASGAVFCLLALRATGAERWREALAWLLVAAMVDAVDGALARWVRVKEALSGFDGALMDNMIDYCSYVLVPAYMLYQASLLPPSAALPVASMICVASVYQFCQASAKTADHYFTGFPSYWNVAVLYLLAMKLSQTSNLLIVLLLILLVFVPIKYIYPSRTRRLRKLTIGLTTIWTLVMVVILWQLPDPSPWLVWPSWLFVGYYVGASLYLTSSSARRLQH